MKKILLPLLAILAMVSAALTPSLVFADDPIPASRGHVNDFANLIPDDVEQRLEQTLRNYETQTTNEIAIVTVQSLGGESIEAYTIRLAEKWGVGKKGKDNGIVMLLAINEREWRVEVGYGLEGVLTDARAKLLMERHAVPEFKKGNFGGGFEKALTEIMSTITPPAPKTSSAQDQPTSSAAKGSSNAGPVVGLVFAGIAAVAFLIFLFVLGVKSYGKWRTEVARRKAVQEETMAGFGQVKNNLATALQDLENLERDVR